MLEGAVNNTDTRAQSGGCAGHSLHTHVPGQGADVLYSAAHW
jgi:hypothetical protein